MDQRVFAALHSHDYRSTLLKISVRSDTSEFRRSEVAESLTDSERRKLDNFLRKMVQLGVLQRGEKTGDYRFLNPMVQMYIQMQAQLPAKGKPAG